MAKYRDWMNNNSAIVTIVAVLVLIGALVWIIKGNMRPGRTGPIDVYFYDMGSTAPNPLDRLFTGKSNELPPIPAPSGKMINEMPGGVRAWVFACGDCKDKSKYFIGYLETYTKDAKDMIENATKTPPDGKPPGFAPEFMEAQMKGHLISSPDGNSWVPQMGREGYKIQQELMAKCPDANQRPVPCNPSN